MVWRARKTRGGAMPPRHSRLHLRAGEMAQAHTVNEWVSVRQVVEAKRGFREILLAFLGARQ